MDKKNNKFDMGYGVFDLEKIICIGQNKIKKKRFFCFYKDIYNIVIFYDTGSTHSIEFNCEYRRDDDYIKLKNIWLEYKNL